MQRVNVPGIGFVNFPDDMSAEQISQAIQNEILPFYSRQRQPVAPVQETTAPAEQPQRGSNLGFAGDLVGSGISGLGGIGTAAGGLYGLATGDYDTGIMRLGRRAQRYGESLMSPELLASREKLERDIQEAGERGIAAEAGAAFRGIATDPRLLTSFVAEQVPQFIGSLGVGRAAGAVGQYAARRGGAEAAEAAGRRAAVGAAIGTGTGLQTGEVADSTYQDVMNLAPEVIERSPNYQRLRQSLTEEEARQSLAVRAAREAAAIAAPISAGTAALFGAERFALGDQIKRRAISRVVLGATGEAGQEGIEEGGGRFARNVGASRADIERDLMQGVGGAAAQGAILGAVIGGGTGLVSGRAPDQTLRGEDDDLRRSLDPFLSSIRRTPGVPGQPEVADTVRLVTENLPVTAEQFLNATARDQEILINRAQRQAEGRLNAENLPVRGPEVERGRIPPSEVQRFPQSASTPSDELVSGQAGARAQGFQFEEGRAEPMEGGITQAEFFRQRAEEMARAQAGTAGAAGRVQVEGAPQLPDNILRRSDKGLLNLLKTASPQDAQLITRELERRRAEKAGAPAAGQPTAAEATAAAAGQTYRPSLGTQTQQTAQAARATRPTSQPISAFFPLVENFIEGHVRNYGSSQPLSVPAFQQYLSERTGDVVSLKRASEIFDTYYNASSKRAVPAGSGWILQRKSVKEEAPKGQPSGRGRGRMPPTVKYGEGAQSQRVYRAVAPKGVNTDADGRPLPPAAPPAAPLRAGPSGFTDPRMRELSGRETEGQPAAATEQAPVEQDEAAVKRAKEIVNDRLDKLEKRGGKKLREAVARVIRDGKFDAEQVYAAFMAADQIAKILPVGANHDIEFVDRLLIGETKAAKASGSVKGKQAQGERLRPTGDLNSARFQQLVREGATIEQAYATVQREAVEGLIRLSLAPNQLPFLRETAAHEAFHVLQDYYKKYDPQFAALMDKSFRDDMMITDLDPTIRRKLEQARFPGSDKSYWQVLTSGLPRPLTAREAQAYAFGSLVDAANRGVPMAGLKPAFARFTNFLRQFFTRMGNALRGDGFQTAESLLGRVGRGDAQRFSGRAVPTARDVGGGRTELSARETETIKSKPGVNARRLAKMLGPQLYGDMKDMGAVSVKEVLQNSFDAIKASLAKGDISQGRIDVDLDGHKIVMTDNGVGMSPEMLGGKFLQIAGTGKSEDERASGGFGIAKMLFLYGNNSLRVTTMKDGRVAELNTTGPQLFDSLEDSEKSPDIEVRAPNDEDRYRFPEGHGTRIEMVMPEEFDNPATGKTEKVDPVYGRSGIPALRFSPLFEDIEVVVNGLIAADIGSAFKSEDYTQFTNVKFPWGTARIYVSKESNNQTYGDNLHVLSNGLWQFSQKLTKEPGQIYSETIPYTFYVDVSPSVRPEDPGYPFTFNRQGFTKEADSEYGKVIKYINALYAVQNLADHAKSFGVIQYVDPNTGLPGPAEDLRPDMPTINTAFTGIKAGDNVTVEKGRLLVNGQELPELSPEELKLGMPKPEDLRVDPSKIKTNQVMIHDNVMVGDTPFSDLMRERFGARYDEYNAYVGEAFRLLRDQVARVMDYQDLMNEAIGVSIDQEYRGVSIRVPFSGSFINPMVPEANDPYRAGFGFVGTMVHELAHHKVRGHNYKFPAEMQRIQYELMADPNFDFPSFQKEVATTVRDQYADILEEAQRIFRDESVTARGNRFADSPYERRSEIGADRVSGRDGDLSRAAGAGERVLGGAVPSNRLGREGGRTGEAARDSAAGRAVDREYSARDIGPETLGNRVRNASPGDVRAKEFEVEYTRVADLINRGLRKVPLAGRAVKETTGEDLIIMMQDRMLPLGRMVDTVRKNGGTVVDASDIYMTEELYHGRVGAAVDDRAERLYKPVFDAMRNLGVSEKDLDDYLMARHAPERNAAMRRINEDPSKGAGITDQQAADIMQRLAPQKTKLDKVAKLVDAIVADTNTTRSGNGLTPDYSKLNSKTQYKHYVPLKGFAEEDIFDDKGVESLRARTGQGFKIRGKEDRSAMGRQSRAGNILANVILQNEESVIRAEKNKVGQALLKLIRDNPQQTARFAKILEKAPVEPRIVNGKVKLMPQGLYRNRDDVMVVKEGGNEVAVQIYDERLAKALTGATGLGAENSSIILNALGKFNRYLAQVNTTLNPEFVISNFARDLQTANINIKQFDVKGLGRKIISDLPSALAGARAGIRDGRTDTKWAKAYDDFRKAGGTTEYLGLRDFDSKIEQINNEITGNKGPLVLRPFKTLGKLINDYNSVAENGIRLATFQTLRDMGVSDAKAAQVAKNLTVNFNKGGQNRILMNSLYLFYNASIQGSMAMVNAIARSKRVRKYVAGIITAGFMHDVINAMMSGMDDDEKKVYDKIPPHVLERNYVLMDPFGLTERGYYAFPMPYGFNAFFNMGRNLSRASRGVGDPMETATSITMGFVEAFNPMGGTQTFFNFVAPTILDPFVDLYSNRNFAGRPISPEQSGFGPPAPDSQRYWSNTFPPYVTVAQWLNQITGGTSVIPGKVDISPNTIGYLMNYATGAAGAFAERVGKFGFSTVPDALTGDLEEVEVRDIPFVRKLYGNVTRRNDLESFMENTNKIAQVQRELDEAEKYGQGERMERVMREYPRELAAAPLIQDMVRERRKITREMNEIRRDPNIDDETKRTLLRALSQEADFYVGQANRIYNTQVRN